MWRIDDPAGGAVPIYESNTCPLPVIDLDTWDWFALYRRFEKGILITAGGLQEQPNKYLDAMQTVEELLKHA